MYQIYFLLICLLCCTISLSGQTFTESFETDGEGSRYESNEFTVGCGTDWYRRTFDGECANNNHNFRDAASNNAINEDGTFYIAGSDVDEANAGENPLGDGESAYMVFPTQQIVGMNNTFEVTIKLAAEFESSGLFEGEEVIYVEYAFDSDIATGANCNNCLPAGANVNTGTYTIVGAFVANTTTNLYQADTDLDGMPDVGGATLSNVFTDYSYTITSVGNPTFLSIRVRFFHSQSSEDVAFDHVRLTSSTVLPVEISEFKVEAHEQHNLLYWVTQTETDNLGFAVEQSLDGQSWRRIGFVEGMGTTAIPQYYSFNDNAQLNYQTTYYRLKQIDFDGRFDYSDIVSIKNYGLSKLEVFPNPSQGVINIQTDADIEKIEILDISGTVLLVENVRSSSNTMDISFLPKGIYFVKMTDRRNQQLLIEKITIQ